MTITSFTARLRAEVAHASRPGRRQLDDGPLQHGGHDRPHQQHAPASPAAHGQRQQRRPDPHRPPARHRDRYAARRGGAVEHPPRDTAADGHEHEPRRSRSVDTDTGQLRAGQRDTAAAGELRGRVSGIEDAQRPTQVCGCHLHAAAPRWPRRDERGGVRRLEHDLLHRADQQWNARIAPRGDLDAPGFRLLLGALSPGGRHGRLTTLIFHRVRREPDPLFPNEMHASAFRDRVRWINEWFNVLPLDEAVGALARGTLPERALAITFDDGYADNFEVALPILREHGVPATFFIATAFLDGGRMWNDTVIEAIRRTPGPSLDLSALGLGVRAVGSSQQRRDTISALLYELKYMASDIRRERSKAIASIAGQALPDDLMLMRDQVRKLAASGMGIGAHTATHPILARVDEQTARKDITDGRDALEAIIRQPVKLFAYPNGKPVEDYHATHVKMVRNIGFIAAVSTSVGAARVGDSMFELPRFTPWDTGRVRWGARLAWNLLAPARGGPPLN